MNAYLPDRWKQALAHFDHAFQPVALFANGASYGFEALLRGWESAGFSSIGEVFDSAFEEGVLYALDLELRRKAFAKFVDAGPEGVKIFYNVDNRLFQMPDYTTGNTLRIAEEAGLKPSRIVFELSERHEIDGRPGFERVVAAYRNQGFRIALDDFGSGYAGLKLLHRAEPDIIKIDRYFVSGAADDPRKAAFLEKIAGLAHLMGIAVVAEGVETEQELRLCSQAGCDMVQGFLIGRPTVERASLSPRYAVAASVGEDRRVSSTAGKVGCECLVRTVAVELRSDLTHVLDRFRKDPDASIIPVVNGEGEPVGIYRERDFRHYVYSPFGISLLAHIAAEFGAAAFLVRAPTAPVGTDLARIVEVYGASEGGGGVVLTEGGRYEGLLPAEELLSLVAERELAEARDQNPLTRLPGNLRVAEVCAQRLADPGGGLAFAYFDFDNFKPFNDRYGFRNGDRVIMLFADILRSMIRRPPGFIGHLGGDDFFACTGSAEPGELDLLKAAADRFAREAASFYSIEDREAGWIPGVDRGGRARRLPLLTVSLAIVVLEEGAALEPEGLSELLAELKKRAKASKDHCAIRVLSRPRPRPRLNGEEFSASEFFENPRRAGRGSSSPRAAVPVLAPSRIASS